MIVAYNMIVNGNRILTMYKRNRLIDIDITYFIAISDKIINNHFLDKCSIVFDMIIILIAF